MRITSNSHIVQNDVAPYQSSDLLSIEKYFRPGRIVCNYPRSQFLAVVIFMSISNRLILVPLSKYTNPRFEVYYIPRKLCDNTLKSCVIKY